MNPTRYRHCKVCNAVTAEVTGYHSCPRCGNSQTEALYNHKNTIEDCKRELRIVLARVQARLEAEIESGKLAGDPSVMLAEISVTALKLLREG